MQRKEELKDELSSAQSELEKAEEANRYILKLMAFLIHFFTKTVQLSRRL